MLEYDSDSARRLSQPSVASVASGSSWSSQSSSSSWKPGRAEGGREDDGEARFVRAERFVAAAQSWLAKDAASVPPRLWAFQQQPSANRLWALRQQSLVGSCDAARSTSSYRAGGGSWWNLLLGLQCCMFMGVDSKMKLWQALGDMPTDQAQREYVQQVDAILPEWETPLPPDAALLRTWTPDDESDQCAVCGDAFTFLNRRHHCRRCLSLVCAVCSAHSLPLQVLSSTAAPRRQRLCEPCYTAVKPLVMQQKPLVRPPSPLSDTAATSPTPSASSDSGANVVLEREPLVRSHSLGSSAAAALHLGMLDFFHGAGLRKAWRPYFFVLLVRKGSLGMFLTAADHHEQRKRPHAVFKLSGYSVRVAAPKQRRAHQFRLAHATKKLLHFAAASLDDLHAWIASLTRAIDCANALETGGGSSSEPRADSSPAERGPRVRRRSSKSAASEPRSVESEFAEAAMHEAAAST